MTLERKTVDRTRAKAKHTKHKTTAEPNQDNCGDFKRVSEEIHPKKTR